MKDGIHPRGPVKFDVRKHQPGHQFTCVQCEKCGALYEPYGKEHKCKKGVADEQ